MYHNNSTMICYNHQDMRKWSFTLDFQFFCHVILNQMNVAIGFPIDNPDNGISALSHIILVDFNENRFNCAS